MKDFLLALSICLGACTSIVPSTLLQLQGLDPLSADPADIALRVDLPDGVALLPGSGTLNLRAARGDGAETSGSFPVEMAGDVLQVAPAAHADLRALQAEITAWKAADPDGTTGSLSVDFEPCRIGVALPEAGKLSIYIRLAADGPFLPLVKDAPIDDALESVAQDPLKPCA
ncbi:hypothetical protein [uncultured Tateyamaria sp.]|uniref:hypothetical protein n=1 Tax=uncultured Tateyamaria sp. TaxID=455651 RepID=UPI002639705D|nr:hypothetical protein [uncultured Tateyamaria sp.]